MPYRSRKERLILARQQLKHSTQKGLNCNVFAISSLEDATFNYETCSHEQYILKKEFEPTDYNYK